MKVKEIFLGVFLSLNIFSSFAQVKTQNETDSLKALECKRFKFFAKEERELIKIDTALKVKLMHYKNEFAYLMRGESFCGNYTKNNYDQIIYSGQNILQLEKDSEIKKKYYDTLFFLQKKMDSLKFADNNILLKLANYALLKSIVDRNISDSYYILAFKDTSVIFKSENLTNYYSNLYLLYSSDLNIATKNVYKKRLISDYFILSRLINDKKFAPKTQEYIDQLFNGTIKNCDDLLPELKVFMSELPHDKDLKIKTINNFLTLLKEKACTGSKEYEMLVDTLIKIDNSLATTMSKVQLMIVKKRYSEAISSLNSAKKLTEIPSKLEDIDYQILEVQFYNLNNFETAYRIAMGISGANKNKALLIAAKCVANKANSCGLSTFDRKCNYYYAAELAQKAGDNTAAASYRKKGPTEDEKFTNNNPSQVILSCWSVTVNIP